MSHLPQTLALVLALCCTPQGVRGQDSCIGLPLVCESVDEICVIQTVGCDHCRVVFIRNGAVLATRLLTEDMLLATRGDGFLLIWQDHWTAERVVEAKKLSLRTLEADPTQEGQDGLWWCMFRNMRDLRAP